MNTMQRSIASCCMALALALTAGTLHAQMFTTANGYVDGQLAGQNGWMWGGTNYMVSTTSGVVNVNTAATGLAQAYWASGWVPLTTPGYIAKTSTDFRYTLSGSAQTGINGMFGVGLTDNGNFRVFGELRYYNGQLGFELSQQNNGGTTVVPATVYLDPSAIGLNVAGSDFSTDLLRMTTTLTLGADANSWNMSCTLLNVTTGTIAATTSASFTTTDAVYTANNGFAWYAQDFIQSIDQAALSSFTILNVNQVTVAAPEPSSLAMIGMGFMALVGGMRIRRSTFAKA